MRDRPADSPREEPEADGAGSSAADSSPAARKRRIGILGGSFDPVHCGHLHVARAALSALDLERVVFVPAAQAPHKRDAPRASAADRMAMLRLAIAGEPRFEISDLEIARGGVSYTLDTVRALPAALGLPPDAELYLLLGSDNLRGLPRWHRARELLELVRPVVVHRAGDAERSLDAVRAELGEEAFERVRAHYLRLPPVPVSSSDLRASIPLRALAREVPPAVAEYIRAHGLYGARS